MKTIGRSLAFYLKYLDEMEALYENGDAEGLLSKNLSNHDDISGMVDNIGDRATEQVFDLLTDAIERAKNTWPTDVAHDAGEGKTSIKNHWHISLWIWPKSKNKKKNNPQKWQTGISFQGEYKGHPSFIAWVWAKGGMKSEEQLAKIFRNKKDFARSKDLGWSSGTIAIGILPLYVQNTDNFEVAAEPFMAEVDRIFTEIAPDLQKIFSI